MNNATRGDAFDHFSARHGDGSCTCGACKARVTPKGRDPLGWVALVAGLAMVCGAMPLLAIMAPLNMMLVPPMFFVVASLFGYASNALGADPPCPACRRAMVFRAADRRVEAELPRPATAV